MSPDRNFQTSALNPAACEPRRPSSSSSGRPTTPPFRTSCGRWAGGADRPLRRRQDPSPTAPRRRCRATAPPPQPRAWHHTPTRLRHHTTSHHTPTHTPSLRRQRRRRAWAQARQPAARKRAAPPAPLQAAPPPAMRTPRSRSPLRCRTAGSLRRRCSSSRGRPRWPAPLPAPQQHWLRTASRTPLGRSVLVQRSPRTRRASARRQSARPRRRRRAPSVPRRRRRRRQAPPARPRARPPPPPQAPPARSLRRRRYPRPCPAAQRRRAHQPRSRTGLQTRARLLLDRREVARLQLVRGLAPAQVGRLPTVGGQGWRSKPRAVRGRHSRKPAQQCPA
jgi:hypothetical protein